MLKKLALGVICLLVMAAAGWGEEVENSISIQGRLLNTDGSPKYTDQTVSSPGITISFYNASTGGSQLGTTYTPTNVYFDNNGVFNLTSVPASFNLTQQAWVSFSGATRTPLRPSPYAIQLTPGNKTIQGGLSAKSLSIKDSNGALLSLERSDDGVIQVDLRAQHGNRIALNMHSANQEAGTDHDSSMQIAASDRTMIFSNGYVPRAGQDGCGMVFYTTDKNGGAKAALSIGPLDGGDTGRISSVKIGEAQTYTGADWSRFEVTGTKNDPEAKLIYVSQITGNVGIGTEPTTKLQVAGDIYANRIGLGTSTPETQVHVLSNGAAILRAESTATSSSNSQSKIDLMHTGPLEFQSDLTDSTWSIATGGEQDGGLSQFYNPRLRFWNNVGGNVMQITQDGNVLIGYENTAIATNQFSVKGTGLFGGLSVDGNLHLMLNGTIQADLLPGVSTAGEGSEVKFLYWDKVGGKFYYNDGSSRKYKKDVVALSTPATAILELNPVQFKWKKTDRQDIGLIAEDVAKTVPELATYKDGQPDGVNYEKLPIYLLQAIKELKAENDALKARVEKLEKGKSE